MKPLLCFSTLTKRWYIVTRYKDLGNGNIQTQTKYDVTDQVEAIGEGVFPKI